LLYRDGIDIGKCTTLGSNSGQGQRLGLAIVRTDIVQPGNTLSSAPGGMPSFLVHRLPMEMLAK